MVLGSTGRNFAAGMSGGIAYVLDETGDFPNRCNPQMVTLEKFESPEEQEIVRQMIQKHLEYTRSKRAENVLVSWDLMSQKFVKVLPKDYARVQKAMKRVEEAGLSGEQAIMAAFEENVRDIARVGGG